MEKILRRVMKNIHREYEKKQSINIGWRACMRSTAAQVLKLQKRVESV